jgi:hypothetical protein
MMRFSHSPTLVFHHFWHHLVLLPTRLLAPPLSRLP